MACDREEVSVGELAAHILLSLGESQTSVDIHILFKQLLLEYIFSFTSLNYSSLFIYVFITLSVHAESGVMSASFSKSEEASKRGTTVEPLPFDTSAEIDKSNNLSPSHSSSSSCSATSSFPFFDESKAATVAAYWKGLCEALVYESEEEKSLTPTTWDPYRRPPPSPTLLMRNRKSQAMEFRSWKHLGELLPWERNPPRVEPVQKHITPSLAIPSKAAETAAGASLPEPLKSEESEPMRDRVFNEPDAALTSTAEVSEPLQEQQRLLEMALFDYIWKEFITPLSCEAAHAENGTAVGEIDEKVNDQRTRTNEKEGMASDGVPSNPVDGTPGKYVLKPFSRVHRMDGTHWQKHSPPTLSDTFPQHRTLADEDRTIRSIFGHSVSNRLVRALTGLTWEKDTLQDVPLDDEMSKEKEKTPRSHSLQRQPLTLHVSKKVGMQSISNNARKLPPLHEK